MKNDVIVISGELVAIVIEDKQCLIDAEDISKVIHTNWYMMNGYAYSSNTKKLMHRLIMKPKRNEFVDHRNRNKLDNRKCNLNIVTQTQNNQNVAESKRNKSGVRGVTYDKNSKKWRVRINIDKKNTHIGSYNTLEEATRVRKECERRYYYNG